MSKIQNIEKILDNFTVKGTNFEDFKNESQAMADITKDVVIKGGDIIFLSLCDIKERQIPGKAMFYVLSEEYISDFLLQGKPLRIGTIPVENIGEELLEEIRNTTGLIAVINNDKYIVSDIAIPTLSLRASVSGNMSINRQNLIRNLHFADAIISKNENIHFVYREIEGVKETGDKYIVRKIFAALGSQFCAVPQTIITDAANIVADEGVLGTVNTREWLIDHEFTDLYLEFPDVAEELCTSYKLPDEVTPGVFMCTSDVGSSSIIARGVFRKGRSYVITDEVMIKHVGNIVPEDVVKRINDEIFPNIRKLPETLALLIGEEIADYSKLDLTKEKDAGKNFNAVLNLLEKTSKKVLKGVLPAKRQKALLECMADEINSTIKYTLYDIAIDFISVPDRVEGLDNVTLTELRKACAKVPFVLADNIHPSTVEKEEEIVLLPA
jgi:hypothetical protein